MSTLRVTEIQSNSTAFNTPVRFETSGGTENGTLCRTWVNFNGQGTVAIRADFNVNTITDNGTGDYTVNFSNSMSDANYCGQVTSEGDENNPQSTDSGIRFTGISAGSLRVVTFFSPENNVYRDKPSVMVSIFR